MIKKIKNFKKQKIFKIGTFAINREKMENIQDWRICNKSEI